MTTNTPAAPEESISLIPTYEELLDVDMGTWIVESKGALDTKDPNDLNMVLILEVRQKNPRNRFISFLVFDPAMRQNKIVSISSIARIEGSLTVPEVGFRLKLLETLILESDGYITDAEIGVDEDEDDEDSLVSGSWHELVSVEGVYQVSGPERLILISNLRLELITIKDPDEDAHEKVWVLPNSSHKALQGSWVYTDPAMAEAD